MRRKNSGFTLVEILIVVIILGILAAVVIPQFSTASNDARNSALQSDLQTLRSQTMLYKVQHLDTYPPGGTFATIMTSRTDINGNTGTDPNTYPYGPYLMKMPTNQFVPAAVGSNITAGTAATPPGDSGSGWYFNTSTGKVSPNDSANKNL